MIRTNNAIRPPLTSLTGQHVRLDPLRAYQLPPLYDAIGSADVFAGGFGGGPGAEPASLEEFICFAQQYFRWEVDNLYAIRLPSGALVGITTLGCFDLNHQTASIGPTALAPEVWGSCVNPESKLLLLDLAFSCGFERISIVADTRNERSRAAILAMGATFEGVRRHVRRRSDNSWRDEAMHSILREEWRSCKENLQAKLNTRTSLG